MIRIRKGQWFLQGCNGWGERGVANTYPTTQAAIQVLRFVPGGEIVEDAGREEQQLCLISKT